MSDGVMTYEDWLRGCVHHDGRNGYVTLPCDEVLKIADLIERLRNSGCIPIEYIKDQIEEYRKFDHLGMYAEFLDVFIQDYKDNAMADYDDRKTEPQRGCDADCHEDCAEYAKEWQDWKDQMWAEAVVTEPQTDMAEDIVRSFGFKAESYRQAKAKDEPQTERSE